MRQLLRTLALTVVFYALLTAETSYAVAQSVLSGMFRRPLQAGFVRGDLLRVLAVSAVLGVILVPAMAKHRSVTQSPMEDVAAEVQVATPSTGFQPVLAGEGCSWWSSGGQVQTQNSVAQIAMCIFEQVIQGVTNPASMESACGNLTLSQVLAALDSILGYYTQPAEAGASLVCGTGTPPAMGANTCVSTSVITQATSARAATAAKMAETQPHS